MRKPKKLKTISYIVKQRLFNVTLISFLVSLLGVILVQNVWQRFYSYALIKQYVEDASKDVNDYLSELLSDWTVSFAEKVENYYEILSDDLLITMLDLNNDILSEINVIDENGIIIYSSVPEYVGWDMSTGEQGAEFLCLLDGVEFFQQDLMGNDYDEGIEMVYAGRAFTNRKGFVEIGVSRENYENFLNASLSRVVKNRRVGFTGSIFICDKNMHVIGSTDNKYRGQIFDKPKYLPENEGEIVNITTKVFGKKSYLVATLNNGYYVIGGYPVDEAGLFGFIDKVLIFIMFIIILVHIMLIINKLLDKQVISEIQSINGSLDQITQGNLEERLNVNNSVEFLQLSKGINKTVDKLKDMIFDAEKRIEQELETAKSIQMNSLPNVTDFFRHNNSFQLYASMETAKTVGGDYYDFYMLPGDILVVTMADVSDKGIPAAMFMMRAKTLMKSLAEEGMSVEEMAIAANRGLWENNEGSMFVTTWIGFIDLKSGLVRYVHAGHTCPVIFGDSEPVFLKKQRQMLMGGVPDVNYICQEFTLNPGDSLFLYTDGVTEAEQTDHEQFGNERLLSVLAGVKESYMKEGETDFSKYVCEKVVNEVHSFCGDAPQSDDITTLCVTLLRR